MQLFTLCTANRVPCLGPKTGVPCKQEGRTGIQMLISGCAGGRNYKPEKGWRRTRSGRPLGVS